MSDPRKYRTHEEEQENEANDPIDNLAKYLVSRRRTGLSQRSRR